MNKSHKDKIARARRGSTQDYATKRKISKALKGEPSNFANKEHSKQSKDKISNKRGHLSRVDGLKWIVNRFTDKTFRKRATPSQKFQYGRVVKKFKDWIKNK